MELDKEFLNDRQSEEEYLDCVRIGRNCKKVWLQSWLHMENERKCCYDDDSGV